MCVYECGCMWRESVCVWVCLDCNIYHSTGWYHTHMHCIWTRAPGWIAERKRRWKNSSRRITLFDEQIIVSTMVFVLTVFRVTRSSCAYEHMWIVLPCADDDKAATSIVPCTTVRLLKWKESRDVVWAKGVRGAFLTRVVRTSGWATGSWSKQKIIYRTVLVVVVVVFIFMSHANFMYEWRKLAAGYL